MADEFDQTTEERDRQEAYNAIPVISFEEMMAVFNKWLLIKDEGVVKVMIATVVANLMNSDPVWLFLLAESGGGKTEIMNSLLKLPQYYPLSQLTANTFLSGYKSKTKEASLLKRLAPNTTIGFKDFTSILDGNNDEMKAIMGQFRDIYDGYLVKVTGTGDEIYWKGKIGFIAGCTPMLEQRIKTIGAMGERFLNYNIKQPKRKEVKARMRQNVGKELQMREELQDAVVGYMKGVIIPDKDNMPALPPEVDDMIDSLADFIAVSRTVVFRSSDTKKELEYIGKSEMSTRTWKQLYTMGLSLYIMNGLKWTDRDSNILRRLAISSVHSIRYTLICKIGQYKTQVKTTTMAIEIGYPTSTTRRYLEDLAAISMDDGEVRILNRTYQGVGKPDLWEITPAMKEILVLMGDAQEAIKSDKGLQDDEKEIPVGVASEEIEVRPITSEDEAKIKNITGDLTEEELKQAGLI